MADVSRSDVQTLETLRIAEMATGDFVTAERLTAAEAKDQVQKLNDAPVPGFYEWMLEVPRRWFN